MRSDSSKPVLEEFDPLFLHKVLKMRTGTDENSDEQDGLR